MDASTPTLTEIPAQAPSNENPLTWFQQARFGMFIHWGLYSLPGGIWRGQEAEYVGEWLQARFRIPNREYARLAKDFCPVEFDADAWVRTAKEAGMRYIVYTAKHHDGFAMYRSRVSPFNIFDRTPFGRDPLAELAQACREHGLKLGLYYSQDLDWSHPDGGDPPSDFYTNKGMPWGNSWDFPNLKAKRFERYFEGNALPQVEELLTNYGDIALLWFDCPVSIPPALSERLVRRVKELQPQCLINSRVGHGLGDYGSLGDNQAPAARREGAWETPGTLNDTWGFKWTDNAWKTPAEIVNLLVSLAAKDANYLLNVGPRPDGAFPAESNRILKAVGEWMKLYGTTIQGTTGNPYPTEFDWGWVTVTPSAAGRGTRLNLILKPTSSTRLVLNGLKERVTRLYDLANPAESLHFQQTAHDQQSGHRLEIDLPANAQAGGTSQDEHEALPRVIVAELETTAYPQIDERLIPQNGALRLLAARAEGIDLPSNAASGIPAKGGELVGVGAAGELDFSTGCAFLRTAFG